jgi:hypothetical protein
MNGLGPEEDSAGLAGINGEAGFRGILGEPVMFIGEAGLGADIGVCLNGATDLGAIEGLCPIEIGGLGLCSLTGLGPIVGLCPKCLIEGLSPIGLNGDEVLGTNGFGLCVEVGIITGLGLPIDGIGITGFGAIDGDTAPLKGLCIGDPMLIGGIAGEAGFTGGRGGDIVFTGAATGEAGFTGAATGMGSTGLGAATGDMGLTGAATGESGLFTGDTGETRETAAGKGTGTTAGLFTGDIIGLVGFAGETGATGWDNGFGAIGAAAGIITGEAGLTTIGLVVIGSIFGDSLTSAFFTPSVNAYCV